jgi:putative transcriptional regulator
MVARNRTFGYLAVEGLREIVTALESGKPLTERHYLVTVDKVAIDTPRKVRAVRDQLGLSQGLFARFLGTSPITVQKWEQGTRRVPKMAARFLGEIHRDLPYWKQRLAESVQAR